ncbi:LysR family transcriptional regulator [Aureibacter tunicatorum]|uniref:DNA-binding transcriptional LysR family regulator n=1 Tax=Aureibacter tunicatorum TaxID=866807 RepID=A0AAE3XR72_9BACT|nr:LysR family transcriptional regulator [Aureibacter tunicatorum]MDR6240524.1 DNA-binding transcriptional LysR family regulator [Aureibacter tunicatorum]BDD06615.1 LysR family transcriptional regulator [Aureibacter tunicatorum]
MDFRLLRFFIAVYEEKNISKAAERCFVSQPSITNGIKQLEEMLSVNLFERHPKGVSPTSDADIFYPESIHLLAEMNRMENMFKKQNIKQSLSISIMPDLPIKLKTLLFEQIYLIYPSIDLHVHNFGKKSDLRLIIREFKHENEIFLPLWEEDYVLCMNANHPLSHIANISLEDLDGQEFIECPPCEAHQQTIGLLSNANKKLKITGSSDNKSEVLSLVASGWGISFLPELLVSNIQNVISKKVKGPRMFRSIGLSYSNESLKNSAVRKIIELISK